MTAAPSEIRTKRLRRAWTRFLFTSAGALVLLSIAGLWWLRSNSMGHVVRSAGGRYRSANVDSLMAALLSGREPLVYHYIEFEGNDVDDQWLEAHRQRLAALPILVLFLRETHVTGDGLSALRGLRNLSFLDLTGTSLTDGDVARIAAIPNLVQLYIAHTGISDTALSGLAQMPNLVFVCIDATQATPAGISGLAACPRLQAVMVLDANDGCVERLTRLNGLTSLDLVGGDVTSESLSVMRQMQGLQSLRLYGTEFSEEDLSELRRALPGCFVEQRGAHDLEQAREAAWNDAGE